LLKVQAANESVKVRLANEGRLVNPFQVEQGGAELLATN
jgi:hypothetical protein